jgi:hypothetical protein
MAGKIQTETQPDSDSQASMQPQRRTHGLADHCGGRGGGWARDSSAKIEIEVARRVMQ